MSTIKKILIIAILTIVAATAIFVVGNAVNNNNNPEHQLTLAYKLLEEGRYDEAIIAFEKVLIIDANNIEAIIGGADAYLGLEDYTQAVDFVKKHNNNDRKILWKKIVEIYLEKGDYAEARKIIYKANLNERNYSKYFISNYITGEDKLSINGSDISITDTGIYKENTCLLNGNFSRTFSSNGENIVYFDKSDQTIKNLSTKTKKQRQRRLTFLRKLIITK